MIIKLLQSHYPIRQESLQEFSKRYSGIGEALYVYIRDHYPKVHERLVFYRSENVHLPDSFAYYNDSKNPFAMQLDPDCDVVVLRNDKGQWEFGEWSEDMYTEIIDWILANA